MTHCMREFRRRAVFGVITLLLFTSCSSFNTAGNADVPIAPGAVLQLCPCVYVTNTDSVTVYATGVMGNNLRPIQTISGSLTELDGPRGLTVDGSRNIYVDNPAGARITVYAAGTSGDVPPIAKLSGHYIAVPEGVRVDGTGDIYVLNYDSISEYAPGASGDVIPVRTIEGKRTGLKNNSGFAMDLENDFYVDHYFLHGTITEYAANARGDAQPIRTLDGRKTGLGESGALAVDASGNVYVAQCCYTSGAVLVFGPKARGNASPERVIAGSKTMLNSPTGVAVDSNGNLYVSNSASNAITIYAPGAKGNVSPSRVISGSYTELDFPTGVAVWPTPAP
jgi:hypothetical protein